MSRDSSGESLESILASIRRSLAEQTTSVLEEEAATPAELLPAADTLAADLDAPPIPGSLSHHLAAAVDAPQAAVTGLGEAAAAPLAMAPPAAAETATVMVPPARTSMLALLSTPAAAPAAAPEASFAPTFAVERAPAVGPAAAVDNAAAVVPAGADAAPAEAPVAAPAAEPGSKDPLWFLSQPPASPPAGPMPARTSGQPEPSRLGAVRGPLPPFFGSSAEDVVKVEMVADRPVRSRGDAMPPLPAAPPLSAHVDPPSLPPSAPDGLHAVNGDAQRVADSAGSGRTSAIFDSPAVDSAAAGGEAQPPQIQALEAMVADLLRPMLRRWLDENMPRLVSAALKAEADVMSRRGSGRDPKKP